MSFDSFRSIVRDVRDSFGSLSRRSFEVRLSGFSGHYKGKSQGSVYDAHEPHQVVQQSRWATLPSELLCDVIKRLEENEATWPSRKHVVSCAAVCKSWREMCKEPGTRDGVIQCFIKRDKSKSTYHLYLCLSTAVLVENGKFLLSAKRNRKPTCTEYTISMDAGNVSRSSSTYIGKLRSNFVGTKFRIYDTQPPYNRAAICPPGRTSRRFYSKKVSPKVPSSSYPIAQVTYELNVLGTRGPRRMHCVIHSIPASSLEPGGTVPGQPDNLVTRNFNSFRSLSSISSYMDRSFDFSSARFSDTSGGAEERVTEADAKERPLVLRNKPPRWHEQLQCWCLNFRGRVTIASVKNFQLIAAPQPAAPNPGTTTQPSAPGHDKIILQFGKVAKDMFTMDYRYPLSTFQAFAICLSSFDTKLACE